MSAHSRLAILLPVLSFIGAPAFGVSTGTVSLVDASGLPAEAKYSAVIDKHRAVNVTLTPMPDHHYRVHTVFSNGAKSSGLHMCAVILFGSKGEQIAIIKQRRGVNAAWSGKAKEAPADDVVDLNGNVADSADLRLWACHDQHEYIGFHITIPFDDIVNDDK